MKMQEVKSANIAAVGYDKRSKTLAVRFMSGSTYRYHDVPPAVARGLEEADSKGVFFAKNIRQNYQFEKEK